MQNREESMSTFFVNTPDNTRIAYDCNGSGPAVMLVHGGGSNRKEWHEAGYVERLKKDFTVISLDLRGHGESDLPTDPTDYSTDKMGQDILSVADACSVERFTIWGMSFGGKLSRYLGAKSERVDKLILMGVTMGPGASPERRQEIEAFCEKWPPILQAQNDGTLDLDSLSPEDREFMLNFNVPVIMAWGQAMVNWPSIEPADLRCFTLWLVGSEDEEAMKNMNEYQASLEGTKVQLHIIDGLDHGQVFDEIDKTFPTMLAFTKS